MNSVTIRRLLLGKQNHFKGFLTNARANSVFLHQNQNHHYGKGIQTTSEQVKRLSLQYTGPSNVDRNFSTSFILFNNHELKQRPEKSRKSGTAKNDDEIKSENVYKKKEISTNRNVDEDVAEPTKPVEEKLTLTARFKKMYKEYWYVLLPVHVATSSVWLGCFYYLSTSGVDIPSLLESLHFSEAVINKLRDSTMGHVAIAYMCYKIATPVRYAVTLGGTTLSIKYLSLWGYIRPVPSKEKLKQMYDDQKAKFNKKL